MTTKNKRFGTMIVGAAIAAAAGGIVFADRTNVPNSPESFLRYQVDSTDELVAAVKADPVLRKRYAKHFGVSEAEVVDFIRRALIPYTLPADRMFLTYGVKKNGRIYPVRTRMKKGERIWATRSGAPVIKWLCANPLTKNLPTLPTRPRLANTVKRAAEVAALPGRETPAELIPAAGTGLVSAPVETYAALPATPILSGGGGGAAGPIALGSGGRGGFPLGPGLLLPLLGFIGSSNNGGEVVNPIIIPTENPVLIVPAPETFAAVPPEIPPFLPVTPPTDIPEPGTLVLAALAGPLLAGGVLRQRARRKAKGSS